MTPRVLPRHEWSRLAGTDTAALLAHVEPDDIHVVVLEDGARIIGACVGFRAWHLEGLWVDPAYQRRAAGRHLIAATCAVLRRSASWVLTSALTERTRRRLERFGAMAIPGHSFVLRLDGERLCHHLQR